VETVVKQWARAAGDLVAGDQFKLVFREQSETPLALVDETEGHRRREAGGSARARVLPPSMESFLIIRPALSDVDHAQIVFDGDRRAEWPGQILDLSTYRWQHRRMRLWRRG
jgi:hypothetical protein